MSVVFKWPEVTPTVTLTMDAETAQEQSKANKKVFPRPGGTPIIIPLGYEGPAFSFKFLITSETEYNYWRTTGMIGTNMVVNSSSIAELVASQVYFIDDITITRKGGMIDTWNLTLRIIRYIDYTA